MLISVGDRLEQAKESYDKCYKKLSEGKGNVIEQAKKLRELGVPLKKDEKGLAPEFIDVTRTEGSEPLTSGTIQHPDQSAFVPH